MKRPIHVAASILCADFANLASEIKKCEDAGIDLIHVDVMDGHFVPNITIGPLIVEAIRPLTKIPIEVHLMIEHPGMYIDHFIDAGADIVSLQVECYGILKEESRGLGKYPKEIEAFLADKARADIYRIKDRGRKVFMVINPGTPVCIDPILPDIDGVLVMSVNPGFAKQKFMPSVLPKIQLLREEKGFEGDIAIDGGINATTAPEAVKAGANILATASYFYGAANQKKAVDNLKKL